MTNAADKIKYFDWSVKFRSFGIIKLEFLRSDYYNLNSKMITIG